MTLLPRGVWAYDFSAVAGSGQVLYYNLVSGHAEVTRESEYSPFNVIQPTGALVIPDSVEYEGAMYAVTVIDEKAFWGCKGLTSVVIPNTVTTIKADAFAGCTGITEVTFGDHVTAIGDYAFCGCTSLSSAEIPNSVITIGSHTFMACSELASVNLGDHVTTIGYGTFGNCTHLSSIAFPPSVTSVDNNVFEYCVSLTNFVIPSSMTTIPAGMFYQCHQLTSITIPSSVTSIGNAAFYGCRSLAEIDIPGSVTTIGHQAFSHCAGLESVTIPNSVTELQNEAFSFCTGLTSITLSNSVTKLSAYLLQSCISLVSLSIPAGVTQIDNSALANCKNLTFVAIPSTVTVIGTSAFQNCTSLPSVTLPNCITQIKNEAFQNCSSLVSLNIPTSITAIAEMTFNQCTKLASITIPEGVTSIGNNAFSSCTLLSSVSLPNTLVSIGTSAFYNCKSLPSIVLPNSVTTIESNAFSNCTKLSSITLPNNITTLANSLFSDCRSLPSITIPSSVTSIGSSSFAHCASLSSINIPSTITSIGTSAFEGCSMLIGLSIPASVSSIGNGAFSSIPIIIYSGNASGSPWGARNRNGYYENGLWYTNNSKTTLIGGDWSLTTLTIPPSVTAIAAMAFINHTALTSVTFPNSVTTIGQQAFYGCINLESVDIPTTVTNIDISAFDKVARIINHSNTSKYSAICVNGYEENGLFFENDTKTTLIGASPTLTDVEIPSSVTRIEGNAFKNHTNLVSIIIPNSVTYMGTGVFEGCTALESFSLGSGLSSTGWKAFEGCTSLTSITIPGTLNEISTFAFKDCTALLSVNIDSGVTSIDDYAFQGCTSLPSVSLPNSVTNLGNGAFYQCNSLTSVVLPSNITSIKNGLFNRCYSLSSIEIPNSVTTIEDYAFWHCDALQTVGMSNSVTTIGSCAFQYCYNLTAVSLPNTCTTISNYAFSNCKNLKSATLGNSLLSLGNYAFEQCRNLLSIIIPNTCTTIGNYAFNYCDMLASAIIGNSVNTIGNNAFQQCDRLGEIIIPNSVTSLGKNAFSSCRSLAVATLSNQLSKIEDGVFYGCQGLSHILLPPSVDSVKEAAFSQCSRLNSLTFNEELNYIGDRAFSSCSHLLSILLPQSLTTIGNNAFSSNNRLCNIQFGDQLQTIGNYAFSSCSNLKSVTIPASVTSIGNNGFRGVKMCVTMQACSPPSLGSDAFYKYPQYGTNYLSDVNVPDGCLPAYQSSSAWNAYSLVERYVCATSVVGHGSVTVDESPYCTGKIVLTATPENGYHFMSWSNGVSINPYSLSLDHDTTLIASFCPDEPVVSTDNQIACDSYTWIDGNTYTESNSTATITLTTTTGCDSTVTLHLILGHRSDYTFTSSGATNSVFTIGSGKQVRFSRGNLQYQASTNTWRFAEHQYDFIGVDNANISPTYDGWIDLFGWGTSGWSGSGANAYQPWSTSQNYMDYYTYPYRLIYHNSHPADLRGEYAQADWAVYNVISNGGNQPGLWRTMTQGEWDYLLNSRSTTSGKRFVKATVAGIAGLIIFPDDYTHPTDVPDLNYINVGHNSTFDQNIVSLPQWGKIEKAGAVFLPVTGMRNGTSIVALNPSNQCGYYWTNCFYSESSANNLYFNNAVIYTDYHTAIQSYRGLCVRPVVDASTMSSAGIDDQSHCDSYTWIDGNTYTASNNTATHTLTNAAGCDSTVTLNLTVNHSSDSTITILAFENELPLTVEGSSYTELGYYQQHFTNAAGCDSTLNINIIPYLDNVDSADCTMEITANPWDAKILGYADSIHSYFTPVVGDIDGDGVVEIVAAVYPYTFELANSLNTTKIRIFRGTDLHEISTINIPEQTNYIDRGAYALVRYPDGSGGMQGAVIVHCTDNKLRSYDIQGNLLNISDINTSVQYGTVSVTDFNHDGYPEICVGSSIYDAATLRRLCAGPNLENMGVYYSASMPVIANVVGDKSPELICGSTIYNVNIVNRIDPSQNNVSILKNISIPSHIPQDGYTLSADFDLDGEMDIMVVQRKVGAVYDSVYFYAYNPRTENILFSYGKRCSHVGYPFIGDIDGDNNLEFVFLDQQENLSDSRITALKYVPDSGVETLFEATHTDVSGMTSMTLFDFNKDDIMEIVYRDETDLRIINASGRSHLTGNDTNHFYNLYSYGMTCGTGYEYPLVADINNDGSAEIIVCGKICNNGNRFHGQLVVLGGLHPWAPARKVWNQYVYNVTCINEDLTVPQYQFNNATVFTDPLGVQRHPYNNFLQQATTIDRYGRPFTAAADAVAVSSSTARNGDNIDITVEVSNTGSNTLYAPYSITLYKDTYRSEALHTHTVTDALPQSSTQTITITIPRSTLIGVDSLVIAVNDGSTGIAQHGGQQPECDTTNNVVKVAASDYPIYRSICQDNVTTQGSDFWVGFLHNGNCDYWQAAGNTLAQAVARNTWSLVANSDEAGTVTASCGDWSTTIDLVPGGSVVIDVPYETATTTLARWTRPCYSRQVRSAGIHVTSTANIILHAHNYVAASHDATTVLPTHSLGTHYLLQDFNYYSFPGITTRPDTYDGSEMCIVATENNTTVDIEFHSTVQIDTFAFSTSVWQALSHSTYNAGNHFRTITLQKGQYIQLITPGQYSFAGTEISSSRPVAVFMGRKRTTIPYARNSAGNTNSSWCCADHLYEQAIPTTQWGKEFIIVPDHRSTNPQRSYFDIVSLENDCSVIIDGVPSRTFAAYENYVYNMSSAHQPIHVRATKPISVCLYLGSNKFCGNEGDPSSVLIPPIEQSTNRATFYAFNQPASLENHTAIVVPTAAVDGMSFDGTDISHLFTPIGTTAFSYARFTIDAGEHTLLNTKGRFNAWFYGMAGAGSYAYTAAMTLGNLIYTLVVDGDRSRHWCDTIATCQDNSHHFKIETDGDIDTRWYVDGVLQTSTDTTLDYTFGTSGYHEVKVLQRGDCFSPNFCDTLHFVVNVNPVHSVSDVQTACDSYTWIDGNIYTESNSTATHTLTTAAGCDSLVALHLTIHHSTFSTVYDTIDDIDLPKVYKSDTYYQPVADAIYHLTSATGCDSVVHYNLHVRRTNCPASSTVGRDFWVMFPYNAYDYGHDVTRKLSLIASGTDDATINISSANTSWSATAELTAGGFVEIEVPQYFTRIPTNIVENHGIHVTSTADISLYSSNYIYQSYDIATVLPTSTLRGHYIVQDYPGSSMATENDAAGSEIGIVATEDGTEVRITLTASDRYHSTGETFTVSLNAGYDFQLLSNPGNTFSGTEIVATNGKPIAVFQGTRITRIPDNSVCCGDYLYEQAVPVDYWGNEFILVPEQREVTNQVRVTTAENNCQLSLDGTPLASLDARQTYQLVLPPGIAKRLTSTKPITVCLYLSGTNGGRGDPASVIIPPVEQGVCATTIYAHNTLRTDQHYTNIVATSATVSGITLDGNSISSFFTPLSGTSYSYAKVPLSPGTHTLENSIGTFSAFFYGTGTMESYAYTAGMSLNQLHNEWTVNDMAHNRRGDTLTACHNDTVIFAVKTMEGENEVQWYIDDVLQSESTTTLRHKFPSSADTHTVAAVLHGGCATGWCDTLSIAVITRMPQSDTFAVACDSFSWYGHNHTASTKSPTHNFVTTDGCDSVVTINLTINHSNTGTETVTACNSFTWHGTEYTASNNTATYTETNAAGCDSIVTLNLTINHSNTGTETVTACDSYTWHGAEYTASNNTATFTETNAVGCDSVVTLNITINHSNTGTETVTACDSYTWHGAEYTVSNNTATFTETNAAGCDSVVTLNLTINHSNTGTETVTACDSYTWHGAEYTASNNTATHTLTNVVGCDSVVTLNLTVTHSNTGTEIVTACDSYSWHGTEYIASNSTATYTETNAAGCDSTVTLNLTISNSTTSTDTQNQCDSYTWIDGVTYTTSNNIATHTLTNAAGCDSTVTLNLTINQSRHSHDTARVIESYTWHNGIYTASTDTAFYYTITSEGCGDTTQLHLTVTGYPDNVAHITCQTDVVPNAFNMAEQFRCDSIHSMTTPYVADLDGDGLPEIIASTYYYPPGATEGDQFHSDGFKVFNGQTGELKLHFSTPKYCIHGQSSSIADVDHDGKGELFLLCCDMLVRCYNYDGTLRWTSSEPVDKRYILQLADIMGDGIAEVVCGPYLYNAIDGALILHGSLQPSGMGFGAPHGVNPLYGNEYYLFALADMDNDGTLEMCAGNTLYKITIASHTDPTQNTWTVLRQARNRLGNNVIINPDGQTIVLDFDLDGDLDICVLGESHSLHWGNYSHPLSLYVWDGQTSQVIAYTAIANTARTSATIPYCGDLNGDGKPEITFALAAGMYSYCYNNTAASHLQLLRNRAHAPFGETAGFTVFDFNQDGSDELVYRGTQQLFIANGATLADLSPRLTSYSGTIAEYPVVADPDNDGHAEILVAHAYLPWEGTDYLAKGVGCISVYGSSVSNAWSSARKVWNQWAYNTVNINEDLTLPRYRFDPATLFPNGKRSFNHFLRQMPYIDTLGNMYNPITDAQLDSVRLTLVSDTVTLALYHCNHGNLTLNAPYPISLYASSRTGSPLWIDTVRQPLAVNSCAIHTLKLPRTLICNITPSDSLCLVLNDAGTGIAQYGAQQQECDTTNNTVKVDVPHNSTGDTSAVACDSFTWWNTDFTNSTNAATHTFFNAAGCDSIVTLNLTINHNNSATETVTACNRYVWHGTEYTSSTSSPTFISTNAEGCDSTTTLHLTVNHCSTTTITTCDSYSWHGNIYTSTGTYIDGTDTLILTIHNGSLSIDQQTACDNYIWIDGNTYTASNNTATFTSTNAAGCDSVITLNLIVNHSSTSTDAQTACDSFTWIDGNTYTTSNNTAQYTLTNANNCDSIVSLNLTINYSNTSTKDVTACDSYTWHGVEYTASNNTATFTKTNAAGCDSIVVLNLTVNHSSTTIDVQTACDSFTWIDGNTYTVNNNSTQYTLTNAANCDSVVTLNLTINHSNTGIENITACETYTWHNIEYTTSNSTAIFTETNTAGCDSVVTLNLTINHSNTAIETVTACNSYTWHGNTYTSSNNTDTFTETNAANCDSVITLNLIINYSNTGTETLTACDSYTWHGATYTTSNNTATFTETNTANCDSVVTLNLTINHSNTGIETITSCNSYIWHGTEFTGSTSTPTFSSTNIVGCDSITTLNLTIYHCSTTTLTACDSYEWNGTTYIESGTYTAENDTLILTVNHSTIGTDTQGHCDSYTWIDGNTYTANNSTAAHTLTNAAGCDSTVTLNLIIRHSTIGTDLQDHCDSYTWIDGNTYTANNSSAAHTLTNAAGCDSTVTLNLTIRNSTTGTDPQNHCDNYTWIDGATYTASNNTATHTLTNAAGCDSTVALNLTIRNSTMGTDPQNHCDSYTWIDGNTYTANNSTATHTLTNAAGCDSTVTINLTLNNSSSATETVTACNNFVWHGTEYTASTSTPTFTSTNAVGCDSVTTLNLTINHCSSTNITTCDSYIWHGALYATSGTYIDGTDTLFLTVNHSTTGTDTQDHCDSYTWIDGNTYTANNSTATHTLTNTAGCDSAVTLNLTIHHSTIGTDTQNHCDSYTWIDGNSYTDNNSAATHTLTNAAGCDSTVTLNLIIRHSTTGTDLQDHCDNYTWIDGATYTASNNTATHTLTNAAGCDSTVTLNLSIRHSTIGTDLQNHCDSYTWIDGTSYTTSNNTATHTLTNAAGCDSTVTLNLTIRHSTIGIDTQNHCDSYTWIDGATYTISINTATHTLTNAAGCDSTVTLNLTIRHSTTGTDPQDHCDNYTWIDGNTYTSNNSTATHTLTNAARCDSTITLNLTIRHSTTGTDLQDHCDSYIWIDGATYTASNNTATHTLTNAARCDSTVTLNLSIRHSTTGTDLQNHCDSYTWIDGTSYTTSNNTATHTLTNAAGCDSTVTLNLIIRNSTIGTDLQDHCDSSTWIDGNTYTSNNNSATHTLTNAAGCDSTITLNLTIRNSTSSTLEETVVENNLPYTFNGVTFTDSTDLSTITIPNAEGCDSIIHYTLHVQWNTGSRLDSTVCDNQLPVTWNNLVFDTTPGLRVTMMKSVVFSSSSGSDSTVLMRLHINPVTYSHLYDSIVENDLPRLWNGATFTATGIQTVTLANTLGCDSITTMSLFVHLNVDTTLFDTVCESSLPYNWNGVSFNTLPGGSASVTLHNRFGADSLVNMNLHVIATIRQTVYETILENELPHLFSGVWFTQDVQDTLFHFTGHEGCDSLITYSLTVHWNNHTNVDSTVCYNQLPIQWNARTFTAAGTLLDTLTNHLGADSVVTMTLHVNPTYHDTLRASICDNQSYTFEGSSYNTSGLHTWHTISQHRCDSLRVLNLEVRPTTAGDTLADECDLFSWWGTNYSTSTNTPTHLSANAVGCDSTTTLHLTIRHSTTSTIEETVVENNLPYTFNGVTFTDSTDLSAITIPNAAGCDSIISYTLHVQWNTGSHLDSNICFNQLPIIWNNATFDTTVANTIVTRTVIIPSATGSDSTIIMRVHVKTIYNDTISYSICDNEQYTFEDITYYGTDAGFHTHLLYTDTYRCDSLRVLNLNVRATTTGDTLADECDRFTWWGTNYSTSTNTPTHLSANAAGCDSTTTLHLTIRHSTTSTIEETVVENQLPYTFNGVTFTDSTDLSAITIPNAAGCDSIISYTLHVQWNTGSHLDSNICFNQLPVTWNGAIFDTSIANTIVSKTVVLPSHTGSDSTIIMCLHVQPIYNDTIPYSICENHTYTFEGTSYYGTDAGYHPHMLQTATYGCDSLRVLNLDVRPTTTGDTLANECDIFSWYGTSYTSSTNTPTHLSQNTVLCDSTTTLHLTIRHSTISNVEDTIVENQLPYSYHDSLFSDSISHATVIFSNSVLCDSIVDYSLFVHWNVDTTLYDTVCNDAFPLTWNGVMFDTLVSKSATMTRVTVTAAHTGADSTLTMNLTVHPLYDRHTTAVICDNQQYTFGDSTFIPDATLTHNLAGASQYIEYLDSLLSRHGCDSLSTLHLTSWSTYDYYLRDTVCTNHTYSWGTPARNIFIPGNVTANLHGCDSNAHLTIAYSRFPSDTLVTDLLSSVHNCDSLSSLQLHLLPSYNLHFIDTICNAEWITGTSLWSAHSYSFEDTTYDITGSYVHSFTTLSNPMTRNCDSIRTLHLKVYPTFDLHIYDTIYDGDTYRFERTLYDTTGIYPHIFVATSGCDSLRTLHLQRNRRTYNDSTVCQNELPITWNDITFEDQPHSGGTMMINDSIHLRGQEGIDSLVVMRVTVHDTSSIQEFLHGCDSLRWQDGVLYTTSTDSPTIALLNNAGCDSVVQLILTVDYTHRFTDHHIVCDSLQWIDRQTYYRDTVGCLDTLRTIAACDSIVTLDLTVHHSIIKILRDTICEGESYSWHGFNVQSSNPYLTEDFSFTDSLQTIDGCDSVERMNISKMGRPSIEFDTTIDCRRGVYFISVTATAPLTAGGVPEALDYTFWSSSSPDSLLIGHEREREVIVAPQTITEYILFADYEERGLCPWTKGVSLRPVTIPTAEMQVTPEALTNGQLYFDAYDINRYESRDWYIDWQRQDEEGPHLHYEALGSGDTIHVSLRVYNGICYDTSTVLVSVLRNSLFAPNAFTPLEDENNRFFLACEGVIRGELFIYNRDGLLVYHTDNWQQGWDGTSNGKICPQAAYVWKFTYYAVDRPNSPKVEVGTVLLVK